MEDLAIAPAATEEPTTTAPATVTPHAIGGLRVEDRAGANPPARGLAAAFREGGFPGETAVVDFGEFRAATFSGSVDTLSPLRKNGVDLGADQRYAWPVFGADQRRCRRHFGPGAPPVHAHPAERGERGARNRRRDRQARGCQAV